MIETVCTVSLFVVAGAMVPALYRVLTGPSTADRVVAADALTTDILVMLVLISMVEHTRLYLGAVMALAILCFFGMVAFSNYVLRGRPID
jgi:multisubunit Na+/H+ antiporter MnhF subunit